MAIQVTIDSIVGQPPYDIYICQTGGTSCFYMTTITSAPYIFDIPAPYNTSDAYMLKIIDNKGCIITGIEPVTICPNVTPTPTPTSTPTQCVNVVTNGNFETNLSGWTNNSGAPWVWSSNYGGSAEATGLDELSWISQNCLTENCEYQITFEVVMNSPYIQFAIVAGDTNIGGGLPQGDNVSSTITTSGIYVVNLVCTGSTELQMYTFDSNGADNVFVKSISACLVSCQTPTPTPTITATQTSTPTVTPTNTQTPTPTITPSSTISGGLTCSECIVPPVIINGVEINEFSVGSVSRYGFEFTSCGTVTTPVDSLFLGATGAFEYTMTFSQPVNNLIVFITAAGQFSNENFIFTTDTGTGIPIISSTENCYTTISGNEIISGLGSGSSGGGGKFTITNNIPFTTLVITGDGGDFGSLLSICANSIT
jgi:hypothetical protein